MPQANFSSVYATCCWTYVSPKCHRACLVHLLIVFSWKLRRFFARPSEYTGQVAYRAGKIRNRMGQNQFREPSKHSGVSQRVDRSVHSMTWLEDKKPEPTDGPRKTDYPQRRIRKCRIYRGGQGRRHG